MEFQRDSRGQSIAWIMIKCKFEETAAPFSVMHDLTQKFEHRFRILGLGILRSTPCLLRTVSIFFSVTYRVDLYTKNFC